MKRIYKKDVISIIDDAQKDYEQCWNVLSILKTNIDKLGTFKDILQSFQYILAKRLFIIDTKFEEISIYRKKIKCQAEKKKLSEYRDALKLTSEIGRSLGDAYVWIFYQFDRDLLESHLSHKRNPRFRNTNGYKAELQFINANPIINNHLVIYHGITTILRLGDISIFDHENSVVIGIAEIKSKPIKRNELTITLHFVMKKEGYSFIKNIHENSEKIDDISDDIIPEARLRLKRQLDVISKSMEIKHNNRDKRLENTKSFENFDNFLISKSKTGKIYDSIVGYKSISRHKKLSSFFFKNSDPILEADKIIPPVKSILIQNTKKNQLHIQHYHISKKMEIISSKGIPPTFWYPVNINILKKIYFMNIVVLTVYNSYVLENKLFEKGFEFNDSGKIIKREGDYIFEIPNLDYYHFLIRFHLIDEDYIVNTLLEIFEKSKNGENQKIELKFNLMV